MGKRLVLYVPDNRQAQVDEWRDRLNYSRLFFEAFDRAVALQKEIDRMSKDGIDPVVERLKRESDEAVSDAKQEGVEAGTMWAREYASKRHLRAIGSNNPELLIGNCFNDLYRFLEEEYESCTDRDEGLVPDVSLWDEEEMEAWFEGFRDGAEEVWDSVSEHF